MYKPTNYLVTFVITLIITYSLLSDTYAQSLVEPKGYPSKTIHMVVPFPPGGVADLTARIIGQKLSTNLGQSVVVENKPGAGGVTGSNFVAKANPDGYTLISVSANHSANPAIRLQLPFDTIKDFAGISLTSSGAYVMVVSVNSNIKTIKDLIAKAKEVPGKINFASAGSGSGTHFAGELFRMNSGIDIVHIPYKGIPEALTDVIAGRVDIFLPPLSAVSGLIKDNKLVALGVTSKERSPTFINIPTIMESGLSSFEWNAWTAILAPAKTPKNIIHFLNNEINKILISADTHQKMIENGADVNGISAEELDAMIASEVNITSLIAKRIGIKQE